MQTKVKRARLHEVLGGRARNMTNKKVPKISKDDVQNSRSRHTSQHCQHGEDKMRRAILCALRAQKKEVLKVLLTSGAACSCQKVIYYVHCF